jgi:hypothetical protein
LVEVALSEKDSGETRSANFVSETFYRLLAIESFYGLRDYVPSSFAGEGTRTLARSLEGCCATVTPHPQISWLFHNFLNEWYVKYFGFILVENQRINVNEA